MMKERVNNTKCASIKRTLNMNRREKNVNESFNCVKIAVKLIHEKGMCTMMITTMKGNYFCNFVVNFFLFLHRQ